MCCDFRFLDLSAVLEPGRPAKTDKPAILDDAIRVLTQLRAEAQELTQTNEKLLEEIKSLKVLHSLFTSEISLVCLHIIVMMRFGSCDNVFFYIYIFCKTLCWCSESLVLGC